MSAYTGYSFIKPAEAADHGDASWGASGHGDPRLVANAAYDSGVFGGAAYARAAVRIPDEKTGYQMPGFLNDFYYRIHIDAIIDFGFLLAEEEREFTIWNAYLTPKTCHSITSINGDEYTISGLTAPFLLNPLEQTIFTITAGIDGSPDFKSTEDFNFDPDDNDYVIVTIIGTRIVYFKWTPLTPVKDKLEWGTDIIDAKDGSEQRISYRPIPRLECSFQIWLENERARAEFEAAMFTGQRKGWGLPTYYEYVETSQLRFPGATELDIDTTKSDFRDGGMAILMRPNDPDGYEIVSISTVEDNKINLSSPITGGWFGPYWVIPIRIGYLSPNIKYKAEPSGGGYASMTLRVAENASIFGYVAETTYNSLPVLTQASLVDKFLSRTSKANAFLTDYDTGKMILHSDEDFNNFIQEHKFRQESIESVWAFREFLNYLQGRLKVVYSPTFDSDLRQQSTIGSGDTTFFVSNIGLVNGMGVNTLRTHLAFLYTDGTIKYREILTITAIDDDNEQIGIDTPLDISTEVGDCVISFLDKYRLLQDDVSITYHNRDWSDAKVKFLRVLE